MTDLDGIRDLYSQLLSGWNEHIEYAVIVGGNTERRAKTVRHQALIAELQARAVETLASQGADPSGRGAACKPGSRPPIKLAPLALVEDIKREALDIHDGLTFHTTGRPATLASVKPLPAIMHNSVAMLATVEHSKPAVVTRAHDAARSWVRRARLMLGHDARHTLLAGTVCGECDGQLAVAVDATTDVRCVGTDERAGCGVVYERHRWIELAG